MEYPEELIKRIKEEYPDNEELHIAVAKGVHWSRFIENCLGAGAQFEMTPDEIVAAFEKGEPEKVREAAEKSVRRKKLFTDCELFFLDCD